MTEPVRRTGNAKRTKHLDRPQEPAVRSGYGQQGSGNPSGLRRSRNDEDLQVRRVRALELRTLGYGYREIGVALGVAAYTAHQDVKRELSRREGEATEQARMVEEARLDKILLRAMQVVEQAKASPELVLKAIDRVIRVVHQRSVLLGLNLPARLDIHVTERTQADLELEELLNEAEARNAATVRELTGDAP